MLLFVKENRKIPIFLSECYPVAMSAASTLTNQAIDCVYQDGGYAWRASSTGIYDTQKGAFRTAAKKGVADVIGCYRGILVALEIKIGKDRLSPEQDGFLKNIQNAGGFAATVTDKENLKWQWHKIKTAIDERLGPA